MSDPYQAIYDATRSRIGGCDAGQAIESALRSAGFDSAASRISDAFCQAASEMERPSVVYRPRLTKDGNAWIALYGENLQEGVVGCGDTPAKAMYAFDEAWTKP